MRYIWRHDRIAGAENTLSFLVAVQQPLADGYPDNDAGRAASSRILQPVHEVETIDQARAWIDQALRAEFPLWFVRGLTRPAYTIRQVPHSQALLCVTAEGSTEND